ncbi:MAG TPA: ATPase P [Oscillibacter sp.]|nr:ATPase P [Oscillibacter sp.]
MIETIVKVDGMMCGMCEGHINDAIRSHFPVKKVSSSHSKGQTVIRSQEALDQEQLRQVIDATGYKVLDVVSRPVEKRGLLGHLKK